MRGLVKAAMLGCALAGCANDAPSTYQGYVEGEYTYVSAPFSGYLDELKTTRGARVAPGQTLFVLSAEPQAQALAEAEAKTLAAQERADNLRTARRAPEIASLEARVREAESAVALTRARLQRDEQLVRDRFVAPSRFDEAKSQHAQALAQLESARAQLALSRDPIGRREEARAADADVRAAQASAAEKRWLLERRTGTAPVGGDVVDTYYRAGEWVPAGQAVASILPDAGRRLRFFVPETELAGLRPGQKVEARCDGCAVPVTAKIVFIAPQAEYTPPVIYSRGSREKLVFRVEAVPDAAQAPLPPGLPVDVRRVVD